MSADVPAHSANIFEKASKASVTSFDIPLFDTHNEKLEKSICNKVDLYKSYIQFHRAAYILAENREDSELPWKKEYINWRCIMLKKFISNIDMFFGNDSKCWIVEIECNGTANSVKLFFKTIEEAKPIFKSLENYIIDETP